MSTLIDLNSWPRRAAFEHFRRLGQPFFSLCARVDVSGLDARIASVPGATRFLAYHHAALYAINSIDAFRMRLEGDGVRLHARVDGSTTLLKDDDTVAFADLPFDPDFGRFVATALPAIAAARGAPFALGQGTAAAIYLTTIPWLDFTQFTHAMPADPADSVPRLAFGKIVRGTMPVAVEVHHALVDGLHVGRFYAAMEAELNPAVNRV